MGVQLIIDKNPLVVKIPMKTYLVKFLLKKYGKKHKASKRSLLGLETLALLTDKYYKQRAIGNDSHFTFLIPYQICKDYGHFVDPAEEILFKKKVERIFKDFFIDYIKINNRIFKHGNIIKSINDFYIFYGLTEEDLSVDYAYKLSQRAFEKEPQIRHKFNSKQKTH